jgi:hypothetical protein
LQHPPLLIFHASLPRTPKASKTPPSFFNTLAL